MAERLAKKMDERRVVVSKTRLIETLNNNREKHIAEYQEALTNYKTTLKEKFEELFIKTAADLSKNYQEILAKIEAIEEGTAPKDTSYIYLLNGASLRMDMPISHESEYNDIITMAEYDERETLELSFAEFRCFIQDEWDWKNEFDEVTSFYNKKIK
jgi:hypothetical protein